LDNKDFVEIKEKILKLIGTGEWTQIREAIQKLRLNTGVDKPFDPYKDPDKLPWNDAGVLCMNNKLIMEALTIFQSQLQCYFDIQDYTKKRIHKGTPYYFIGETYLHLNNIGSAREQFLFAYIEDILTELQTKKGIEGIPKSSSAFNSPVSVILELTFRMRKEEMEDLYNFTKQLFEKDNTKTWLYPEDIILKWRNYKEKNWRTEIIVSRAVETTLFHTNKYYLQELLEKAEKSRAGEYLEELATYLFSCVDGFEPISKKTTKSFHFDVLVRNLTKGHPLLSMLGEYIGVEAKNIKKTVSAEELNHFIHKLRLHNMHCGIIITRKGLSGVGYEDDKKYGRSIQVKTFNRDNLIVFDITLDDIERIIKGDNLVSLLLLKYEDIRYM
jgi:hypothetical protein